MPIESLSKRERQILNARARGHLNKQISSDLLISVNTVKHHLTNVFVKLNVKSSLEAVALLP